MSTLRKAILMFQDSFILWFLKVLKRSIRLPTQLRLRGHRLMLAVFGLGKGFLTLRFICINCISGWVLLIMIKSQGCLLRVRGKLWTSLEILLKRWREESLFDTNIYIFSIFLWYFRSMEAFMSLAFFYFRILIRRNNIITKWQFIELFMRKQIDSNTI